ncbi:MAG: hypothetical protein K6F95_01230 [Selenomonas sp.]|nr:hypothetical protein [Selenomonas sp.]
MIVVTGLSNDARGVTVLFRSAIGFIGAGLIVYIAQKILAAKDIFDMDAFVEATEEEALAETENKELGAADDVEPAADEEQETGEAKEPESGEDTQFEPLNSEELTRMKTPE